MTTSHSLHTTREAIQYRRQFFKFMLQWAIIARAAIAIANLITYLNNPVWTALIPTCTFAGEVVLCVWCLYAINHDRLEMAMQLFLFSGLVQIFVFQLFNRDIYQFIGPLGAAIVVAVAIFSETPRLIGAA